MKTGKLNTLLFPIALLVAVSPATAQEQDEPPPVLVTPDTRTYVYQCGDERSFEAEYSLEMATIELEGETLMLPQIPAASGARYSDGTTTLYTKGNEAFVEVNGEVVYQDCVAQTNEAEEESPLEESTLEQTTTETTIETQTTTETTTQTTPSPASPATTSPAPVPALW